MIYSTGLIWAEYINLWCTQPGKSGSVIPVNGILYRANRDRIYQSMVYTAELISLRKRIDDTNYCLESIKHIETINKNIWCNVDGTG